MQAKMKTSFKAHIGKIDEIQRKGRKLEHEEGERLGMKLYKRFP